MKGKHLKYILLIPIIIIMSLITFKVNADYKGAIIYNNSSKLVKVDDWKVIEMHRRGYGITRILDLLALQTMECNKDNGDCIGYNFNDYGPFQINMIHKEQFNKSISYRAKKDWYGLYMYQLTYANRLVESYMNRFCDWKRSINNKRRFQCIAVSYNGHPRYKHTYKRIARQKRKVISKYLYNNFNFLF